MHPGTFQYIGANTHYTEFVHLFFSGGRGDRSKNALYISKTIVDSWSYGFSEAIIRKNYPTAASIRCSDVASGGRLVL